MCWKGFRRFRSSTKWCWVSIVEKVASKICILEVERLGTSDVVTTNHGSSSGEWTFYGGGHFFSVGFFEGHYVGLGVCGLT